MILARSSLVTTRAGTWKPVERKAVRCIGLRAVGECGRLRAAAKLPTLAHGSQRDQTAVRCHPQCEASSRRLEEGSRRREAGRQRPRAPPDIRGGHGAQRALLVERPHRRERRGDGRLQGVRRPGPRHHDSPGVLLRIPVSLLACLVLSPSLLTAQKRAIGFEDFIALKSVSDPQLSPDGKWVAYTVTTPSLQDNRGISRVWVVEAATGRSRQLTGGPGSDRQPRWSPDGKTLAFISTREGGAQVWLLPIGGGDARKLSSLPDGASDPSWLPDGSGLLVVSDIKWPANQEIDQRNGAYPTDARIWTGLMWRHWDDFRAGKRQHLFRVDVATGKATDLTPVDHDVPAIATSGDGDVTVSPDGKDILVAMHGDSTVADNTNVDIYAVDGPVLRQITTSPGADNTPRDSPDNHWATYLSMERAGFQADRVRLMIADRTAGRPAPVDATAGWTISVGSYTWCPNSKCIYAVVEERGRDNIYRIDVPGYKRTRVITGGGNTGVQVGPDNKTLAHLHQGNAQPPKGWVSGKAPPHHTDTALVTPDPPPPGGLGPSRAPGEYAS